MENNKQQKPPEGSNNCSAMSSGTNPSLPTQSSENNEETETRTPTNNSRIAVEMRSDQQQSASDLQNRNLQQELVGLLEVLVDPKVGRPFPDPNQEPARKFPPVAVNECLLSRQRLEQEVRQHSLPGPSVAEHAPSPSLRSAYESRNVRSSGFSDESRQPLAFEPETRFAGNTVQQRPFSRQQLKEEQDQHSLPGPSVVGHVPNTFLRFDYEPRNATSVFSDQSHQPPVVQRARGFSPFPHLQQRLEQELRRHSLPEPSVVGHAPSTFLRFDYEPRNATSVFSDQSHQPPVVQRARGFSPFPHLQQRLEQELRRHSLPEPSVVGHVPSTLLRFDYKPRNDRSAFSDQSHQPPVVQRARRSSPFPHLQQRLEQELRRHSLPEPSVVGHVPSTLLRFDYKPRNARSACSNQSHQPPVVQRARRSSPFPHLQQRLEQELRRHSLPGPSVVGHVPSTLLRFDYKPRNARSASSDQSHQPPVVQRARRFSPYPHLRQRLEQEQLQHSLPGPSAVEHAPSTLLRFDYESRKLRSSGFSDESRQPPAIEPATRRARNTVHQRPFSSQQLQEQQHQHSLPGPAVVGHVPSPFLRFDYEPRNVISSGFSDQSRQPLAIELTGRYSGNPVQQHPFPRQPLEQELVQHSLPGPSAVADAPSNLLRFDYGSPNVMSSGFSDESRQPPVVQRAGRYSPYPHLWQELEEQYQRSLARSSAVGHAPSTLLRFDYGSPNVMSSGFSDESRQPLAIELAGRYSGNPVQQHPFPRQPLEQELVQHSLPGPSAVAHAPSNLLRFDYGSPNVMSSGFSGESRQPLAIEPAGRFAVNLDQQRPFSRQQLEQQQGHYSLPGPSSVGHAPNSLLRFDYQSPNVRSSGFSDEPRQPLASEPARRSARNTVPQCSCSRQKVKQEQRQHSLPGPSAVRHAPSTLLRFDYKPRNVKSVASDQSHQPAVVRRAKRFSPYPHLRQRMPDEQRQHSLPGSSAVEHAPSTLLRFDYESPNVRSSGFSDESRQPLAIEPTGRFVGNPVQQCPISRQRLEQELGQHSLPGPSAVEHAPSTLLRFDYGSPNVMSSGFSDESRQPLAIELSGRFAGNPVQQHPFLGQQLAQELGQHSLPGPSAIEHAPSTLLRFDYGSPNVRSSGFSDESPQPPAIEPTRRFAGNPVQQCPISRQRLEQEVGQHSLPGPSAVEHAPSTLLRFDYGSPNVMSSGFSDESRQRLAIELAGKLAVNPVQQCPISRQQLEQEQGQHSLPGPSTVGHAPSTLLRFDYESPNVRSSGFSVESRQPIAIAPASRSAGIPVPQCSCPRHQVKQERQDSLPGPSAVRHAPSTLLRFDYKSEHVTADFSDESSSQTTQRLIYVDKLTLRKVSTKADFEEKCVICMSEFMLGEELRSLNCGHKFHRKCIDQWLKTSLICPICRTSISQPGTSSSSSE